jgi:FkbM family methyltransferase
MRRRPQFCVVQTGWGDWLGVDPHKFIGGAVYMRAVHELPVCEALSRLVGEGETAVDVGANIGVMTSLLSCAVGPFGRVLAFEPHPKLFRRLERNVQRWGGRNINVFNAAVSLSAGMIRIREDECFEINEGTARVAHPGEVGRSFEVQSCRLDDVLPVEESIVIKIDVEGHDFEVLSGATGVWASRRARDIVFESTWEFPGQSHRLLTDYGYQLFDLQASFLGPELARPARRKSPQGKVCDYVATLDPERARRLFSPRGWRSLRARGRLFAP